MHIPQTPCGATRCQKIYIVQPEKCPARTSRSDMETLYIPTKSVHVSTGSITDAIHGARLQFHHLILMAIQHKPCFRSRSSEVFAGMVQRRHSPQLLRFRSRPSNFDISRLPVLTDSPVSKQPTARSSLTKRLLLNRVDGFESEARWCCTFFNG
ncbi:hypothetical protein BO82DRAFT_59434 [Aspergillus uvarum CBS 121591]|uniref:Uncharacterized protein n=1 Tax=Aspergillus uvarum CBS 121591 TaxID=1448315 RepID=A0A319CEC0_9EURO|nr:hypothetical protein BO82DRAFT_59434 [Aspergillus uvarum CBS 121591]PYH82589.1 hypothetical protein BO82DRAFT_59434 [Aspergillus uvarum CBS 121591]